MASQHPACPRPTEPGADFAHGTCPEDDSFNRGTVGDVSDEGFIRVWGRLKARAARGSGGGAEAQVTRRVALPTRAAWNSRWRVVFMLLVCNTPATWRRAEGRVTRWRTKNPPTTHRARDARSIRQCTSTFLSTSASSIRAGETRQELSATVETGRQED